MTRSTVAWFWQLQWRIQRREMPCSTPLLHRQSRATGQTGFTLVEMMIVVVIVGVLATLATYGVIKYVRTARTSEAFAMVIDIKAAEEAYRDEMFRYHGLAAYDGWHPSDPPGNFKKDWRGNFSAASGVFRDLGVVSSGPVYFTYTVVAGMPDDNVPNPPTTQNLNFPSPAGQPFYVVVAKGDLDGDGDFSYVVGHSFGSDLFIEQEGE